MPCQAWRPGQSDTRSSRSLCAHAYAPLSVRRGTTPIRGVLAPASALSSVPACAEQQTHLSVIAAESDGTEISNT